MDPVWGGGNGGRAALQGCDSAVPLCGCDVEWNWCPVLVFCRFKWEVLRAVMANDFVVSSPDHSLSLTAHLGKPQKPPWASPRSWRARGSRRKLQANSGMWFSAKKYKNTPQKPANEPAEPFVVLLILGRKRGLKNCEALRGPQWELDTALSFRINTKVSSPQS